MAKALRTPPVDRQNSAKKSAAVQDERQLLAAMLAEQPANSRHLLPPSTLEVDHACEG
jgi:hypothetical protein